MKLDVFKNRKDRDDQDVTKGDVILTKIDSQLDSSFDNTNNDKRTIPPSNDMHNGIDAMGDIDDAFDYDDELFSNHEFIPDYADEFNPHGLPIANHEDKFNYKNIKARPNLVCMLILIVEFAERGSYYGTQGILTNFIMRPLPDGSTTGRTYHENDSAGALGMGLRDANALVTLLQFLAYVMPLAGGYLADAKLGRFKAIMIGVWIGIISHILFIIAALPPVIAKGESALAPTIIAIILLAFCTGMIKPNLLPLLLDQFPYRANVLKRLPSGEVVYIDRDGSIETLTLVFYWSINIGAFLQIATSYAARDIGYWLAFLCPGIMYCIVVIVMLIIGPKLKKETPQGSIIGRAARVLSVCFKGNFIKRLWKKEFWAYAYPSHMEARGQIYLSEKKQTPIYWTDQEVRDYKSTFTQCIMFLYWVAFNLNDTGLGSTLNAQAGAMITKNVPNDLFNNFNQITIVALLPLLDYIVYPLFKKYHINFNQTYKCFVGFMFGAFSSMVGAILQWRVYETSPCGYYATDCADPSTVTAWYEIIVYALAAAGECFCYTTAYELAYTRAPDNAKGLVMALFLLTNSFSSAISEAVSAALIDPHLIWPFVGLAAAGAFFALAFLIQYWNLDKVLEEEERDREAARQEKREIEEDKEELHDELQSYARSL